MDNVSKVIQALDEAAKPVSEVRVLTLSGNVNAQRVRQALTEMLGEKARAIRPGPSGPSAAFRSAAGRAASGGRQPLSAAPPPN
jgi:hypothetical protein